jgi:uncharacterized protein (DUF362 family)
MLPNEELPRRRFLGFGAAAATLAFLGRTEAQYSGVPGKDSIIISENGATPIQLVAGAFDALGGIRGFVSPGDIVLVKPNASFNTGPDIGANTSPAIVSAVTSLCIEAGADRVIMTDHTIRKPGRFTVISNGLREATEGCGGEFVVLEGKSDFETVKIDGGNVLESVDVAKLVSKSDVLINLPVLKHHYATGACAGLKNLMGLVYDRGIFHDEDLWVTIADLSLAIRPDLTIVDATRVMTKNGPGGEPDPSPEYLNRVVAGVDPVAVDVAALSMVSSLGYPDFEIREDVPEGNGKNTYIGYASDLGIGEGDPEAVAQETYILDATEGDAKCIMKRKGIEFPDWAPYAMLSGASIALGGAALLYDRRTRFGAKKR